MSNFVFGSPTISRRVSTVQPNTCCNSAGVPSAVSFAGDNIGRLGMGSVVPEWLRLVRSMASGTTCGYRARAPGKSGNTWVTSSTNTSARPSVTDGRLTAMGRACANGTEGLIRLGAFIVDIMVQRVVSGFQSEHQINSFAKSLTISEIAHQVGGFGDPPKVSRRDT
jgi:hypothetical protein